VELEAVREAVGAISEFGLDLGRCTEATLKDEWDRQRCRWRAATEKLGDLLLPDPIARALRDAVAAGSQVVVCPDEYLFGVPFGAIAVPSGQADRKLLWSIHPEIGAPLVASSLVSLLHSSSSAPSRKPSVILSADKPSRFAEGGAITSLAELVNSPRGDCWIHVGHVAMDDGQPTVSFPDGQLSALSIASADAGSLLANVRQAALLTCRSSDFSGQDEWARHELEGLFAELLSNGCERVIGSCWPLARPVAQSVAGALGRSLAQGTSPLEAWGAACAAARTTTVERFGDVPFLWCGLAQML